MVIVEEECGDVWHKEDSGIDHTYVTQHPGWCSGDVAYSSHKSGSCVPTVRSSG